MSRSLAGIDQSASLTVVCKFFRFVHTDLDGRSKKGDRLIAENQLISGDVEELSACARRFGRNRAARQALNGLPASLHLLFYYLQDNLLKASGFNERLGPSMFDFSGKVAVITGAAGNLGHTVATALHDAGASLALVDINEGHLRQVYEQSFAKHDVLMIPTDLTDEQSVKEMAAEAHEKLGGIDVLTNIAGGFDMGPLIHETPVEDWKRMLDINATSMFLSSRACVPYMLKRGSGRIVSVSARAALHGKARMGPYVVSKAAVIRLTETMAEEHKNDNITVNCILPGTIDTPQNRDAMPNADHSKWVSTIELAHVVLFLASSESRAVNGAAIPVYGRS